ncbi:MAG: hypothetical protein WD042_03270 [Phycisphaeraceae bacterium]
MAKMTEPVCVPSGPDAVPQASGAPPAQRTGLWWVLRGSSMFLLVTTLGSLVVLGGVITLTRGRFAAIFEDFDTTLPLPTQWLMDMPLAIVLLVLSLLAAGLIAKEIWVRNTVATILLNILAQGMLIVFVVFYVLAMWLPLVKLITSLT